MDFNLIPQTYIYWLMWLQEGAETMPHHNEKVMEGGGAAVVAKGPGIFSRLPKRNVNVLPYCIRYIVWMLFSIEPLSADRRRSKYANIWINI